MSNDRSVILVAQGHVRIWLELTEHGDCLRLEEDGVFAVALLEDD